MEPRTVCPKGYLVKPCTSRKFLDNLYERRAHRNVPSRVVRFTAPAEVIEAKDERIADLLRQLAERVNPPDRLSVDVSDRRSPTVGDRPSVDPASPSAAAFNDVTSTGSFLICIRIRESVNGTSTVVLCISTAFYVSFLAPWMIRPEPTRRTVPLVRGDTLKRGRVSRSLAWHRTYAGEVSDAGK